MSCIHVKCNSLGILIMILEYANELLFLAVTWFRWCVMVICRVSATPVWLLEELYIMNLLISVYLHVDV